MEGLMKDRLLHTEGFPWEIRDGKLRRTLHMPYPPSSATTTCDKMSPPSNMPEVRLSHAVIFFRVSSLVLSFFTFSCPIPCSFNYSFDKYSPSIV